MEERLMPACLAQILIGLAPRATSSRNEEDSLGVNPSFSMILSMCCHNTTTRCICQISLDYYI